jgi:hypothetical protein
VLAPKAESRHPPPGHNAADRERAKGIRLLDQPSEVAELAHELIPDDAREHFFGLYLNRRNQLVATT